MNTVSAPSGIGAPVKMRIASPGANGRPRVAPACSRPRNAERPLRLASEVLPAHRVAVDCGVRERRQLQRRDQVAGENAAIGVRQCVRLRRRRLRCKWVVISATASSTDRIGAPDAKQSFESCATAMLRLSVNAVVDCRES